MPGCCKLCRALPCAGGQGTRLTRAHIISLPHPAGVSKSYTLEAGAGGQQVLQTDGINIRGVWPCQVVARCRLLRCMRAEAGLGSAGLCWRQLLFPPAHKMPSAAGRSPPCAGESPCNTCRHRRQRRLPLPPCSCQDLIDCDRMSTNNPAAMLAAYGVEACRATIVKEVRWAGVACPAHQRCRRLPLLLLLALLAHRRRCRRCRCHQGCCRGIS